MLKVEQISKKFTDGDTSVQVLKDVSLEVETGELVAIVGPSGSGKSTLLSIIGALLSPSDGRVSINKEDISTYSSKNLSAVRLNKIGFIFQSSNLVPFLTVENQLLLVRDMKKNRDRKSKERASQLIYDLGLSHRSTSQINQLSGGEKQRVAIARAFMNDPDLILADEPTASLDSERGRKVVEMLSKEVKEKNKAALMVTHDERMLEVCDRVLYIEDGRIKS
ncbi:ABC transporter ATP-binding protein [Halobacillus andaensis]|uniref:ABC transporter ATP-binding protein n=1 Tax=Halobacillus andaensis TaxID=1176239 RepID=A0A917B781_HALAA|nr:ABC transporter ATP-binding protein [Halobacillus andaensis]MBP2005803.1 putative ABC transport system ATP-binding protein [Halobacillus andaensis]GGF25937.1 ABC transporter ATP-binding protein [Halobacillus andaensis]